MAKVKTVVPLAVAERFLKKTKMRIGIDAKFEFAKLLEEIVADISAEAVAISKKKGRRTVSLQDIMEVRRKVK
ncbi:MAG TPA: histone-like protein [archaeon]|nr:histone-like protein [archaeon]